MNGLDREFGTGYRRDKLVISDSTGPGEIINFAVSRAMHPIVLEDVTVWNFSDHMVDVDALAAVCDDLERDLYLIPYSVGPIWSFMQEFLPFVLASADYLVYRQDGTGYHPRHNFLRDVEATGSQSVREFIAEVLNSKGVELDEER